MPLRKVMAPCSLLRHQANNLALRSLSACYNGFRLFPGSSDRPGTPYPPSLSPLPTPSVPGGFIRTGSGCPALMPSTHPPWGICPYGISSHAKHPSPGGFARMGSGRPALTNSLWRYLGGGEEGEGEETTDFSLE
jgi:hypothetical protein